ncbi:MAG: hypothetical protein ACOCSQ_01180, partial [Planctomycetota bacterium]
MASRRSGQIISTALTVLVCLSALWFGALKLSAQIQHTLELYRTTTKELEKLESRVNSDTLPTKGAVREASSLRDDLTEELERSASFYIKHNKSLNRRILESWQGDAYQIAIDFRELKSELASEAGNPDFLELGRLDEWEKRDQGRPAEDDIKALEKKASIAKVLTDTLTANNRTVIKLMEIQSPESPSHAPDIPADDWDTVRYDVYPVDVSLRIPFKSLRP